MCPSSFELWVFVSSGYEGHLFIEKCTLRMLIPKPLFDTRENCQSGSDGVHPSVLVYLEQLSVKKATEEYWVSLKFLDNYKNSADTFNSYRREIERFLQWLWLIKKKGLDAVGRNDIQDYVQFVRDPPKQWIAVKNVSRFIDAEGGVRQPNPGWRPSVVSLAKAKHNQGYVPDRNGYSLGNKSLAALLSTLSTYFTYLQQDAYLTSNPVQLLRQKSRLICKEQTYKVTRKLSRMQWQYVVNTAERMANYDPEYERNLFLVSIFYLLGLRISEVSETERCIPKMSDFAPDKNGMWWFTTVGKGNKMRDVAVPDDMLATLRRYRLSCGLSPLPARGENTPLIAKQRGRGNLGTRQVRNLIQVCFDQAILQLKKDRKIDEAQDLEMATVHWLRHTAISADVEFRPREHVRDDAGHESAVITDHYIDTDRIARHDSAKNKQLKPQNLSTI
jgi:site-specific recombinase XerD